MTIMQMEWPGVTEQQYHDVFKALGLDHNPPTGGILHVAGFSGGTMRVLDVWESQTAFETFQRDRLMQAVQKAGIQTQPKVQFYPLHNIYAPNLEAIRRAGASSMPTTMAV
jgi:hypothetical protein